MLPLPPLVVDREIMRDAGEVSLAVGYPRSGPQPVQQPDEAVVDEVIGRRAIADDTLDQPREPATLAGVEIGGWQAGGGHDAAIA